MPITDYHAKYYAFELTKRCSSDSFEKLSASLSEARVDLNPHQIEAALFAFRSPLSKGAILAEEVGLGKTIEAGIVLSQKWAERKRKILIIVPASLRKQWNQELLEKFYLPSIILETKSFNVSLKRGKRNPFDHDEVVICSYQFARAKADEIMAIRWDLVILDEAHRLRNSYKPTNKIGNALKVALSNAPKLLLTATPLQNSLLELYGLVSFIDEYTFGDIKSFRNQFARLSSDDDFRELKARLAPICKRTLRRQVLEYTKYTNRIPITQEFTPTPEENRLYDLVSDYLRRENLQALPSSQRALMTLVLRKLLASSTFAIAGALQSLIRKLKAKLKEAAESNDVESDLAADYEALESTKEEWNNDEESVTLTATDVKAIYSEIEDLESFVKLAVSITENAKGKSLLQALKTGFAKAKELGANQKAIIFTESRRSQEYLLRSLSQTEFANGIVLFNGSNSDNESKRIYKEWMSKHQGTDKISGSKTADMRSALVDYFRNQGQIMIATEAAAEGINLQFCSLVINYDLPWNPQRIEQRIGRCHRYGQQHDVVVVNFLNRDNAADKRVYELLSEKFALFSGVFGASDEVLGAIESGVDFEKRIVKIYQECRSPVQIEFAFDQLQSELETEIDEAMKLTRHKLLENFDEEVHEKLKVRLRESADYLSRFETRLWDVTQHALSGYATFDKSDHSFKLSSNPFSEVHAQTGLYRLGRNVENAHVYRVGHPLAHAILKQAYEKKLPESEVVFDYSNHPIKISILEPLIGKSGYLSLTGVAIESLEAQDYSVFCGLCEDGTVLDTEQLERLFSIPGVVRSGQVPDDTKEGLLQSVDFRVQKILDEVTMKNSTYFDEEMDKLDRWADDLKTGLEYEIKELDKEIKLSKAGSRQLLRLEEKLVAQKQIKELEKKRNEKRRRLFESQDEIDSRKEGLIENIESRLKHNIHKQDLFTIKWRVQ
jgi:ERCC4-related helicase